MTPLSATECETRDREQTREQVLKPDRRGAPGAFITFEGIEGSGKSTQIALLADRIRVHGREVVTTREPGGTDVGLHLRSLLLGNRGSPPTPVTELLLYSADRAQHLEEVVEPALRRGAIVLCDRYLDATLAYQGYGRHLGCEFILAVHRHPPLNRRPDRTVLLDLEPQTGLRRARRRNETLGTEELEGRFEDEALAFHQRVRDGYLLLAQQVDRVRVLDADGGIEEVQDRVWEAVRDLVIDRD